MLGLILVLVVSAVSEDCRNPNVGYTLTCNRDLDPWKRTKQKMDVLKSDLDSNTTDDSDIWKRLRDGKETVSEISEIGEGFGSAVSNFAKKQKTIKDAAESSEAIAENAEAAGKVLKRQNAMVAKSAKGAKSMLKRGMKVAKAVANFAQFVGPIMDIILLFAPATKSDELVAIEAGFAEISSKIDTLAYNLENIQDALAWNAILPELTKFEAVVRHTTKKYEQVVEAIKTADISLELPLHIKNQIEDLVEAIKLSGDIGNMLQLVDSLFRGNSGFTDKKNLLEIFVDAVNNDCSKILPMANTVMRLVKDAQRLQYFYEINQQLIKPHDDKGYPKMVYDMYTVTMTVYETCTKRAILNAREELQVKFSDGGILTKIIDAMESKYDLYNWATMKETEKEEENFALVDNSAGQVDVELTGISDDEKKKQRLTLFAVRKASKTQAESAIQKIAKVLNETAKDDMPKFDVGEDWSNDTVRYTTLNKLQELFSRNDFLKSLIDSEQMTMVMFKNDSTISLTGWHLKTKLELTETYFLPQPGLIYPRGIFLQRKLGFILGFLFNFKENQDTFKCSNGHERTLTIDGGFQYCFCNMGYGGEACDISLSDSSSSTLSSTVLDIVDMYKVPGIFDLQEDIKKGTQSILHKIEDSKLEIFSEIRNAGRNVEKSKNAILSAQSVMLNDMKMETAKVLKNISGLKAAMEATFERERNDRIYRTKEGQKVVMRAISDSNRVITDSIRRLTGKVIENRYFRELKIYIPVFQEKFQDAINYGGYAEPVLSEYLKSSDHFFQAAKEAAKKAMLERKDSFVMAQMQISMVDGCTQTYTSKITSTWAEMMELHLTMTTIEFWDLDYKIRMGASKLEKDYWIHRKAVLMEKSKSEIEQFKDVMKSRSCPEFSYLKLLGGGCGPLMTYPGQNVPMQCKNSNETLVLISNGEPISGVLCNENSNWAVNMDDLQCVLKCQEGDDFFDIGEKKRIADPPIGYFYGDKEGNKVTVSTCVAPMIRDREQGFSLVDSNGLEVNNTGEIALLLYNGGTVCDDGFSDNSANAICREMGYSGSSSWVSEADYSYGDIQTNLNITLDNVVCRDDNWDSCSYSTSHDCRHHEDVFLTCIGGGGLHAAWSTGQLIDIDECADPNFCNSGGTCTNTRGSFSCSCSDGYSVGGDGKCQEINECSVGEIGYQKCLVQRNLGQCYNTEGSYRCTCLTGSYAPEAHQGKQCEPCNCDSNRGVTSAICDQSTGSCLCKTNVIGNTCSMCDTGFETFPYCTRCAAGYYGYPNCRRCSCSSSGVTSQYCDRHSGRCLCKTNVVGNMCDRCRSTYTNYPSCVPDVRHGYLSHWSSWSSWTDDSSDCGGGLNGYNTQRRTRTRTCNDSTKNIHGRSCSGYSTTETDTRRHHDTCQKITELNLKTNNINYSGSDGYLWMRIRQGSIQCTTHRPSEWYKIYYGQDVTVNAHGCDKYFNKHRNVEIYLESDTTNQVNVVKMGVRIGPHAWKHWTNSGGVWISRQYQNGPYTAS